jgi:hypothetical protein
MERLASDMEGLSNIDTYLSGPGVIVDAVKSGLVRGGWAPERVFTEPLRHTS